MSKKIELADIVMSSDFLREICRAAVLSYEHKKESGFSVYCDEQLSQPQINKAIFGRKTSIEAKNKQGFYIPMDNYRLVSLHFHPPKSNIYPSGTDIDQSLNERKINVNLRETLSNSKIEVYRDEKKTEQLGYNIDFPNPVCMIGLVRDKPENIEFLVYQGITEEPIKFCKFSNFVADYCQRLNGRKNEPIESQETELLRLSQETFFLTFGFPIKFTSTKTILEFLNSSKYLQAADVKIRNGQLSNKDLRKLRKFELIKTRFFPDYINYTPSARRIINLTYL